MCPDVPTVARHREAGTGLKQNGLVGPPVGGGKVRRPLVYQADGRNCGAETRVVGVLGDALGADLFVDYAMLGHAVEERSSERWMDGVFKDWLGDSPEPVRELAQPRVGRDRLGASRSAGCVG